MLTAFNIVRRLITPPAAIANTASPVTTEIDTAGFAFAVFNVLLGATDIALTALKLQESETSGSGMADIAGAIFGTSNNDTGVASTLPSATDDNKLFSFFVDLRYRKRYLDLLYTVGTGSAGAYSVAWVELWRASDAPRTAVEAGYAQRLIV